MPSPAATQLFAVRRRVVALLQAHEGVTSTEAHVLYGWPGDTRSKRKMVYTDARATGETTVAGMRSGRVHYDERGRFELTIRVEVPGKGAEEADTQTEEIALAVAECLSDNRYLETEEDGPLVNWVRLASWASVAGFNDNGYLTLLTNTYEYDARLT